MRWMTKSKSFPLSFLFAKNKNYKSCSHHQTCPSHTQICVIKCHSWCLLTRKGHQQTQETMLITASCVIISTSSERMPVDDALAEPRCLAVAFLAVRDARLASISTVPLAVLQSTDSRSAVSPRLAKTRAGAARVGESCPCTRRKHQVPGYCQV